MNDRSASQAHLFNRVYTFWKILSDPHIPEVAKGLVIRQRMPEENYLHCQQVDATADRQQRIHQLAADLRAGAPTVSRLTPRKDAP